MSPRPAAPFARRFTPGRWRDLLAAGWTLWRAALWIQRDAQRQVRRWSRGWWLTGYLLWAGRLLGWWVNPLLLALRRIIPGGTWLGDRHALLCLTWNRRHGRWTISDFAARRVGAGIGRPLLDQVCAAADQARVGLRLVAHNDTLAAKVYAPAGFITVDRTRLLSLPVMHRDPKFAVPADEHTERHVA